MNAETLLRKLHLQGALADAELQAYLNKVRSDGSLPPSEIPILLELMSQRTEKLSIEDIRAVGSLAGGDRPSAKAAGKIDEGQAMRAIVSKLIK